MTYQKGAMIMTMKTVKPITERCVSVAHLMPVRSSPYWDLRRKVLAMAEAIELEKDSPDRDTWADKFAIDIGIGL